MKVNDSSSKIPEQPQITRESPEAREAARRRQEEAAAQAAQQAAESQRQAEAPPEPERAEHFNQVKNKVNDGSYVVDSYAVADKFLREAIGIA